MLGRYHQPDPLGPINGNLFAYARNNPLRYTDPYGLYSWEEFGWDAGQFAVAFGDAASFGLTTWIRSQAWYGGDYFTDECSRWYQFGGFAGDVASAFAPLPIGHLRKFEKFFKLHRHHMIPWEFRAMSPKGLNIEHYTRMIPAWRHNLKPAGIHTGPENYNKLWRDFFEAEGKRTSSDVLDFMWEIDRRFDLGRWARGPR